ncbi:hydrolase [Lutibacter flavus]|uniref:GyrI-like small molecule binding domain-containing protein n=1 Tax=Lutibacter flavus TaxID=691689 RepID=A0A238X6J9_9FLAO|nr:hydrolase [Lutibacter flavus]SNR53964.1 hypothetical protein SAMN04488111_1581 [Lutibacter flavus]
MKKESNQCCPKFSTEKWDKKTFNWNQKPFIKSSIPTFFHIPIPRMIGKKVTRMMKLAEESKKIDENIEDTLLLFTDPSPFKSDLLLSVTGNVTNAKNTSLTGVFMSKVFDGPYNSIPKFIKQLNTYLSEQGKKAKNHYVHYAYCPKCAKKYGNNYMVLFAEIA